MIKHQGKIKYPQGGVRLCEADFNKLWQTISEFSIPFGVEYLKYKHGWIPAFATRALEEYRRFAFLALASSSMITPSECIDEVWHLHILHTNNYEQFAKACGTKLQHIPGMPNEKERFEPHYDRTHELYFLVFGDRPPSSHWPRSENRPSLERALKYLESP